ncbi:MAG TPA: glucodextranase DOMON-like domain-containing protein [Streptosporangiaceae bacterium]|nr:glucodextranase DOMON-like domain-containing protein [Streptosporangiaceae bacterium]
MRTRGTAGRRLLTAALAAVLPAGMMLATAPAAPAAPLPGLRQAFDNVAITTASDAAAGNYDGIGDSFSAPALAADALAPGRWLLHDGLGITWPDVAPGTADNVVADGQTVAVSGKGTVLGVVGASAYGNTTGTFTVTYADGTTTTATVTFADWVDTSPAAGTDLLATTGGWNPGGTTPVSLSYAAIPLTAGEPVVSVTLPEIGPAVGKNVAAMHVFSLTVGSPGAQAAGAPGAASYYDEARKDCVGTAAGTASKAWYTVADGTLSDVYAPTIDNTDVKSLDPIVTGPGFTALQPRDMTYTVTSLDATGMACQVTALDAAHHFRLVTDFITDPAAEAVVMRISLVPLAGAPVGLAVYLRFNPLLNGHAGGGSGNAGGESATVVATSRGPIPLSYSTSSFTEAVNRSYARPIYAALASDVPFQGIETGYAGTASDGLSELDSAGALTSTAPDASNGNVVQTVKLALGRGPAASRTVALGFGGTEAGALSSALHASAAPFAATYAAYQAGWRAYDARLLPPGGSSGRRAALTPRETSAYWLSANVLKASEDKTFPGATAASLASPWGQAVPAGQPASDGLAPYFGSYREVFPRDAYETFTGFLTDGDLATARQIVEYMFDDMQLPNGSFPRNGLLNGKAAPDTGGLQLDEAADPILEAWQAGLAGDRSLYLNHIRPAADFLVGNGPADGVERWEEQSGFSPSTMADEVAGLVAAAAIARVQGDATSQRLFLATADDFRRLILATTVTSNGPLSAQPYFIRVGKTGDPDQAFSYTLGNGDPTSYDQRSVVDQGFLELVRLGELPASDPLVANSLAVTGATISAPTPSGTGILRYNGDGYGDCEVAVFNDCQVNGQPWATTDQGTGHPWPVLSGENGEYQVLVHGTAALGADLGFMRSSASGVGLVPEQVWNYPDVPASPYGADPATASIGFTDGQPDGSAAPLTWAQAQLLRLISDMAAGRLLEQPSIVADRYLPAPPAVAPLAVTAPLAVAGGNVPASLTRPSVTVDAASVTVTGTTSPGATVDIAVTGTTPGAAAPATSVTTVTAGASGAFSAPVSLRPGTDSVEVAATAGGAGGAGGGTNEAIFTVTDLFVPGTVVLSAAPATGGGNGPGTYAYPTAANSDGSPVFAPGSFRLNGLTVINSGSTVTFQVGIANLQSTFGSLDGAQLVDLYIHAPSGSVPGGETQSTGAAGAWNYSLAPASGWNQLIEVDGFGTDDWVTPSSAGAGLSGSSSVGTPQVSVAQLSPSGGQTPGLVTITVPTSVLGTPGPGWTFTVTLTGQDGFGNDDARAFTATPGDYTLGVCSAAEAGAASPPAICSADPSAVPVVMDTIPPAGVNVQTELDPTASPSGVTLQGVTVP